MTSLKKQFKSRQEGFTIIELLIVIVVIGILAALVITTFSGIQQKARNTERTTDIKALSSQLEAYYTQNTNSSYPTLANMNDPAWRSTNVKGLEAEAIKDPRDTSATPVLVATPTDNRYSYAVLPAGCDNSATPCTSFTLTAKAEGGADIVKTSLN